MGSPATAGFGVWGYGVNSMSFVYSHIRQNLRNKGIKLKHTQSEASSKHRRCDPKAKRPHTS